MGESRGVVWCWDLGDTQAEEHLRFNGIIRQVAARRQSASLHDFLLQAIALVETASPEEQILIGLSFETY